MKPLGRKNYGSIPHLLGSKLGATDKYVSEGMHRILTEKTRDKFDFVIVTEKYDGSNVGIAKNDGEIIALTRSGYLANTSPYEQHHFFSKWVEKNKNQFEFLKEGERLVGEWLLQKHSLGYELNGEPFVAFDYFGADNKRKTYLELIDVTVFSDILTPRTIHHGHEPFPVESAMEICMRNKYQHLVICKDNPEGVVYRVERKGKFDFAAKFVREDFEAGKYVIGIDKGQEIWNTNPILI